MHVSVRSFITATSSKIGSENFGSHNLSGCPSRACLSGILAPSNLSRSLRVDWSASLRMQGPTQRRIFLAGTSHIPFSDLLTMSRHVESKPYVSTTGRVVQTKDFASFRRTTRKNYSPMVEGATGSWSRTTFATRNCCELAWAMLVVRLTVLAAECSEADDPVGPATSPIHDPKHVSLHRLLIDIARIH